MRESCATMDGWSAGPCGTPSPARPDPVLGGYFRKVLRTCVIAKTHTQQKRVTWTIVGPRSSIHTGRTGIFEENARMWGKKSQADRREGGIGERWNATTISSNLVQFLMRYVGIVVTNKFRSTARFVSGTVIISLEYSHIYNRPRGNWQENFGFLDYFKF